MQTPSPSLVVRGLIWVIALYRNTFGVLMLPACRFAPSCSQYATESLRRFGAIRGLWRAAGRLLRCHPLAKQGLDPVS